MGWLLCEMCVRVVEVLCRSVTGYHNGYDLFRYFTKSYPFQMTASTAQFVPTTVWMLCFAAYVCLSVYPSRRKEKKSANEYY